MYVLFASIGNHSDRGTTTAYHILCRGCGEIMGYGVGDESKLVAHEEVINVQK